MSLLINKISTQRTTETADILFPIYDLLHIQIFYRILSLGGVVDPTVAFQT